MQNEERPFDPYRQGSLQRSWLIRFRRCPRLLHGLLDPQPAFRADPADIAGQVVSALITDAVAMDFIDLAMVDEKQRHNRDQKKQPGQGLPRTRKTMKPLPRRNATISCLWAGAA